MCSIGILDRLGIDQQSFLAAGFVDDVELGDAGTARAKLDKDFVAGAFDPGCDGQIAVSAAIRPAIASRSGSASSAFRAYAACARIQGSHAGSFESSIQRYGSGSVKPSRVSTADPVFASGGLAPCANEPLGSPTATVATMAPTK
jgi:hypothetical protein